MTDPRVGSRLVSVNHGGLITPRVDHDDQRAQDEHGSDDHCADRICAAVLSDLAHSVECIDVGQNLSRYLLNSYVGTGHEREYCPS